MNQQRTHATRLVSFVLALCMTFSLLSVGALDATAVTASALSDSAEPQITLALASGESPTPLTSGYAGDIEYTVTLTGFDTLTDACSVQILQDDAVLSTTDDSYTLGLPEAAEDGTYTILLTIHYGNTEFSQPATYTITVSYGQVTSNQITQEIIADTQTDPPVESASLAVGAQNERLTFNTNGTTTFSITSANISSDATYQVIWSNGTAPTGLSVTALNATSLSLTLTATSNGDAAPADAGIYYFNVVAKQGDTVLCESAAVKLSIDKASYTGTQTISKSDIPANTALEALSLSLPTLPSGASYGAPQITSDPDSLLTSTPTITLLSQEADEQLAYQLTASTADKPADTTAVIQIPVTGATNYLDYTLTVTLKVTSSPIALTASTEAVPYGTADAISYTIRFLTESAPSDVTFEVVNCSDNCTQLTFPDVLAQTFSVAAYTSSTEGEILAYAAAGTYTFQIQVKSGATLLGTSEPITFTVSKGTLEPQSLTQSVKAEASDTVQVALPALPDGVTYGTPTIASELDPAGLIQMPLGAVETQAATETDPAYSYLTINTTAKPADTTATITLPLHGGNNYLDSQLTIQLTAGTTAVILSGIFVAASSDPSTPLIDGQVQYSGMPVTYSGSPIATLIGTDGETQVPDTELSPTDYSYTWQEVHADGSCSDLADNLPPSDVGSYQLVVSVRSANGGYTGTQTIPFTITPKPIAIGPNNVTVQVGDPMPSFSLDISGVETADLTTEVLTFAQECTFQAYDVQGEELTEVHTLSDSGTYLIRWENAALFQAAAAPLLTNYTVTYQSTATLTVTRPDSFAIQVSPCTNGTVTVNATEAAAGTLITVTVAADTGYQLDSLVITDSAGTSLPPVITDSITTFTMPDSTVTVTATFRLISTEESYPFSDVSSTHWARDAIQQVSQLGLMYATSQSEPTFEPELSTSRAMIVTILWRMSGSPQNNLQDTGFSDVPQDQWYSTAIAWAARNGIVAGYDTGTFGPSDPVTREQLVAILYRYANYKGQNTAGRANLELFSDAASLYSYATEAMSWAVSIGVISGFPDGTVQPTGFTTRAQLASILVRYLAL